MVVPSIVDKVLWRGRADQRDALDALVAGAAGGRGGTLLLHGEPGAGKTALLTAAAAMAAGFTVLSTTGSAAETGLPYAGLHRLLRPILRRGVPLPFPADGAGRFELCVALLETLCRSAEQQPLLCTVDDADLLDPQSLDALAFVARRLDGEPIAVLFAAEDTAALAERLSGVPALHLPGLDPMASRELLDDLLPDALAGDVAGVLAAMAAGNPGALTELARSLTPEQCRGEAPPPACLPADSAVRRRYQARLVKLPERTRWLVLLAAADPELDARTLIRVADSAGIDLSALEPAEAAGLVRLRDGRLAFPQPLVRCVVYDEAPLARRREAHRLLAEALDPRTERLRRALHLAAVVAGPDGALATELEQAAAERGADQATASLALERAAELTTEPVAAADRLVSAARHAWAAGEPHRARMLLRQLRLAEVPHHVNAQSELLRGEIELRAGATAHARQTLLAAANDLGQDRYQIVSALVRAGEALCLAGDYPRFAEVARQALAMRRPDEPLAAELMFEQLTGMTAMFAGSYARATGPLRRVLGLAAVIDEPVALLRGGVAGILLGDDAAAYRLAMRAASVAGDVGDVVTVPLALELAGAAEFALGRYDSATVKLLDALRRARASGQDSLASGILATLAVLAAVLGDRQTCLVRVREARVHTTAHGVSRTEALIDWALGARELVGGRPAEAFGRMRRLTGLDTGHGQLVIQVAAAPHVIEAAVRSGDRAAAKQAMDIFEPWTAITDNPAWLALAARCRALLSDCESTAADHFREAIRQHEACDADFERARTELLFGQELRRNRRPAAAREHLRSALDTFRSFDARPWAEQTFAELRAAGEQVERPSNGATELPPPQSVEEALTPQQRQIARLAADGATNREVAAQLFLSTRTVDHHMRNIFSRLGIRSRVELAKLL